MYMITAFSLLFFLSFANGANDVSKAVATLAGARVTSVKKSVLWGTAWTAVGAIAGLFLGSELIKNMMGSLYNVPAVSNDLALPLAVALAAIAWVSLATWRGWPVSTTHAIVGGLIGSGIVALGFENISWSVAAHKILLPLLFSPFIAIGLGWFLGPHLQKIAKRAHGFKICLPGFAKPALAPASNMRRAAASIEDCTICDCDSVEARATPGIVVSVDSLHWLTSGLLSLSRGLNDAPKLIAVALPFIMANDTTTQAWLFLVSALAMSLGGLVAGRKITEILGFKVTKMDHEQGFSANLIAAFLVIGASRLGLPVSTTHVSASAIMGTGLGARAGLNKNVVTSIIFAWLVTVPSAAVFSAAIYWMAKL